MRSRSHSVGRAGHLFAVLQGRVSRGGRGGTDAQGRRRERGHLRDAEGSLRGEFISVSGDIGRGRTGTGLLWKVANEWFDCFECRVDRSFGGHC